MNKKPLLPITSVAGQRMLGYQPTYYGTSRTMRAIMQSQGAEVDQLRTALDEVLLQYFVETATWGIVYWERLLGIPVNNRVQIEWRRANVIAKMQAAGPMTRRRMEKIVSRFLSSGNAIVTERFADYILDIVLPWVEFDYTGIVRTVEEIKPAHLAVIYYVEATTNTILRTISRAWLWRYPLCNIEQTISKQGIPLISHLCLPTSNRQTRWNYLLSGEITTQPRKGIPLLSSLDIAIKTKRIVFDYSLCNIEKTHTNRGDCIVSCMPIDTLMTQSILDYPLCTLTVATSAIQSAANVAGLRIRTHTTTALNGYSLCGYFMPEKLAGIGVRSKAEITSTKYSRAFLYQVCNDTAAITNQKGDSEKKSIDLQTKALAQNRPYNLSGLTVAISNKGHIMSGVFPFTTKYSKTHIPYKMCGQMTARSDVA